MKHLKLTAASVIITAMISCGGGTEKEVEEKKVEKQVIEEAVEELPQEKELVEVTVIAKGESMSEIAFEPASMSIPANSKVKLTLNNQSSAEGMLHNFVLVELGTGQEIATAGIKAGSENNFVPNDDRVIAYTVVSKMGETVTIEFDAPAKGSYHYICTYPGHYPKMIGRLNVE